MRKHREYYIDNCVFYSEAEIDKFVEKKAVESFKQAIEMFRKDMTMESSVYADKCAEYLVQEFGYTLEQIESIEIEA